MTVEWNMFLLIFTLGISVFLNMESMHTDIYDTNVEYRAFTLEEAKKYLCAIERGDGKYIMIN